MLDQRSAPACVGAAENLRAYQAGVAALLAQRRRRMAALCDLLAEGVTITAAAKVLGFSASAATRMMAQVRAELGWQAQ